MTALFDRVVIATGPAPRTTQPVGTLVMWFEPGSDDVWLDAWWGDGPWVRWAPGTSIVDCLRPWMGRTPNRGSR